MTPYIRTGSLSAALCLATSPADAAILYTVDCTTDELLTIDTETGEVSVVGPLGLDARNLDLTAIGDQILAVGAETTDEGPRFRFIIDPGTGEAGDLSVITLDGTPIEHTEGLATLDGVIWIGFHSGGPGAPVFSNRLGVLQADASITDSVLFEGADFDALGANDPGTGALSVDSDPPTESTAMFLVTLEPPEYSFIGFTFAGPDWIPLHDLVFAGGRLFGNSLEVAALFEIDPKTAALLQTIPLSRPGAYCGLTTFKARLASDLDGDGSVGFSDLLILLTAWGPCDPPPAACPADLDDSGEVGSEDLLILLSGWSE